MAHAIYLTVVLPVRNEEAHISETLWALASQDYPKDRYELIVVDGQSDDATRDVVQRFKDAHPDVDLRLLDNPGRWSSRARNIGIREARGEVIAVIDGHVHVPNGRLFESIERLQKTHGVLCLSRPAPLLVPARREGLPYWIALARKSWLGHSRNSYIYSDHEGFVDPTSSGFAYHRDVFSRVGYFDESFDAAEDCEFHHRLKKAGIEAYTSPDMTIYSFPRETLGSLFRQMTRYGIGRARLVRKYPDALTKETLIPPAIFLSFAVLPLAAGAFFGLLVVYWLILLATGLASSLRAGRLAPGLLVAAAVFITHIGLGWGFLSGIWSSCGLRAGERRNAPRAPERQSLEQAR